MELARRIEDVFQAAQSGDTSRLEEILKLHPQLANAENVDGLTPLGYAAHYGKKDAVQVLLDYGAEVNAVSHSKVSYIPSNTALHAAIAGERELEVIKLLLARGARSDILDSDGQGSLHTAAFHSDQVDIIQLLLEYGADLNSPAEGGATALAVAIECGNHKVAKYLREQGARI